MPTPLPSGKLTRWQLRTGTGLFVGYCAYYVCRSNLAVAAPLLMREFGSRGLTKEVLGELASVGVLCYAVGKVGSGVLGDVVGGKKIFLLGMVGSVLATVAFGLGQGVGVFFAAWAANRLVQSLGWAGLVKTTANWFSYRSYGRIMGLLSLSFLAGDIAAKLLLGRLLALGVGWRGLFGAAAAALALVALLDWWLLAPAPASVGLPAPAAAPGIFAHEAAGPPASVGALLRPYFRSPAFLLVLGLSLGFTALREALGFWLPTYFVEAAHLPESTAAAYSALYSGLGMVSILGAGYLSDAWLGGRRGPLLALAGLGLVPVLLLMARPGGAALLPLGLSAAAGLLLLGPYSFLAGAMALDIGGQRGAATASGLIDAVGYLGSTGALWLTGRLAERHGWGSALLALAGLAAATGALALVFLLTQERRAAAPNTLGVAL